VRAEGVELINKDIADEGLNTVIIGACSYRVNYDVFNFGLNVVVERVNLREQVAWVMPPKEENTQELAEDNLRMGCSKAKDTQPPEPFKAEEEYSKDVLVVGGGLAGMTAALEAAKAGYQAILVEKEETWRFLRQNEEDRHPSL
jgi:Heterodisulfide reductase, subunit A and related polyferredoxins